MRKKILILGASGTVGSAVFRILSGHREWTVTGTWHSAEPEEKAAMRHYSMDRPEELNFVLDEVQPDLIISSLTGNFEQQLRTHEQAADYLSRCGGKIIFISTANVFDGSLDVPHYEEDTRISVSDYGKFKIRCEEMLEERLGDRAMLVRLPFVWGRNSRRMREVKAGCEAGKLEVYDGLMSNHAADLQIAKVVEWMVLEDAKGIFHIGCSDLIAYPDFIRGLIAAKGWNMPEWTAVEAKQTMAVLSRRADMPEALSWDSGQIIRYLAGADDFQ